jgi:signal transduction histidine kinase
MLGGLFGNAYSRGPESDTVRKMAADLIEDAFDEITEEWSRSIEIIFGGEHAKRRPNMANALVRFAGNLRNRDDLSTYIYLRRHCQEGMISRAKPSEFNTLHIALKQIILNHVSRRCYGRRLEPIRDAVVAAIDERRLMVNQFYIESRESALRASEDKYRSSIDHAPDPMYEIDPATLEVLGANSAAHELHRMLPYENETPLIGQRLYQLTPVAMQPLVVKHIAQVVAKGSDQHADLPIRGRYFDINSALITSGRSSFIQMILHDVTQRHEMLDTLLKAERLAAAGTFASGVAHEVNNPLASISSLVQSLLPGENIEDRRAALSTILSQITRIATTLKDLVNFGRPAPAERRPVDLNTMINETLRLVAYNKRFAGIRLEPSLAPDVKAVFADGNGIQQVLLNLLFNAADARSPRDDAEIRVITENQPGPQGDGAGRVVMLVTDNGNGIPRENLERVFDPFFTTKPAGSGVGLGLSLCQSIVLNNHGTISIESRVGSGTRVRIWLPVFSEAAQAEGVAAS